MTEREPLETDTPIDGFTLFKLYRKIWGKDIPFDVMERIYTEELLDRTQKEMK
jgi:hypothetical protein